MKNLIYLFILVGSVPFFTKCKKEQHPKLAEVESLTSATAQERFPIYRACWDEWGRASKDCKRAGLCNFEDGWFGNDPCGRMVPHHEGTITVEGETNQYMLTIPLTQSDIAIIMADEPTLTLRVDEDIQESVIQENGKFWQVKAGSYPFIPSIGDFGGYKIPVILN